MRFSCASQWIARLELPDASLREALHHVYGEAAESRLPLLRRVTARFLDRFGDRPIRVFRAPGRINLRGMHVDSHGGWLNLMTHQREVVAAVAAEPGDLITLANVDARFDEVQFDVAEAAALPAFRAPWLDFIMHPAVRSEIESRRGWWGHYVKGSVLSVQRRFPDHPFQGMNGVIGSDLPRGAALSSSAALCLALTRAMLDLNRLPVGRGDLITAARDAEWYTGSRCGLSDQAAIVLGDRDAFVNIAIIPSKLETDSARRIPFPESLRILVINSFTERSLSGAAQVEYTRNRFAYSLAMEILRQELWRQGAPGAVVERMDRLSNMQPDVLAPLGGMRALIETVKRIPHDMDIAELRSRYDLPEFDDAYQRYFASAPESERPARIALRGPLLFGIAESERARLFPETIASGAFDDAGRLLSIGHDGDRRPGCAVDDAALDALIASGSHIETFPGAYGASTAALDALVDTAMDAGALGASLTGAGMAGTVLALCRSEQADEVAERVHACLSSKEYQTRSGRQTPLSDDELMEAILPNVAIAHVGEFVLPPV